MNLAQYGAIAGADTIKELQTRAAPLRGKRVAYVNSTRHGGGVAEMLQSLVPLFGDLGISVEWLTIEGDAVFFETTKRIHHGLQGSRIKLSKKEQAWYEAANRRFAENNSLAHDLVVVHDPQPLAAIAFAKKTQPWIWRCHVDLSEPDQKVWNFLSPFLARYDRVIVSSDRYLQRIRTPQTVIWPAIDPLSEKNRPLDETACRHALETVGVPADKPIVAQISRYDQWKDPEGVIEVFQQVKKEVDCRLVLMGNSAADDPEGAAEFHRLLRIYGNEKDLHLLMNVPQNDLVVNALQRQAAVVVQKSLKEGFALTVSEALYKGTPVVASDAGGIPLQITDDQDGYLCSPSDDRCFKRQIISLLKNPTLRESLGSAGHEYVVSQFLLTRLAKDWLNVFQLHLASGR